MKLIDIIKESSNNTEMMNVGNSLKEQGWQVKISSSYYPTINVISPSHKKSSFLNKEAEQVLDKIPQDVYGKENRRSWVLGYLSSNGMLE